MNLLVLIGWLFFRIKSATGTQCLTCAPMPSSVPCVATSTCSTGQECYAKYVMRTNGTVMHEFGCHDSQICPGQTHALIGKRSTGDNQLCYKCCQGDMCNLCTGPSTSVTPIIVPTTVSATAPADPCTPSPCIHGSCFRGSGGSPPFVCLCSNGYMGTLCDTLPTTPANPCTPNPCLHGSCFIGSGNNLTFFCMCSSGYTGLHCETTISTTTTTTTPIPTSSTTTVPTTPANLCFPSPCVRGSCYIGSGNNPTFFCLCPSGFTGLQCETTITTTTTTTTPIPTSTTTKGVNCPSVSPSSLTSMSPSSLTARCSCYGDSRCSTLDRSPYFTSNLIGEFVMYRSTKRDFEVQTRTWRCGHGSCNCAIAMKEGNNVAILDMCGTSFPRLRVPNLHSKAHGMVITTDPLGSYLFHFPSGAEIKVTNIGGALAFNITAPESDLASTEGICGFFDGNRDNDLRHSDGKITSMPASDFQDDAFVNSWRVRPIGSSLFDQRTFVYDPSLDHDMVFCRCDQGQLKCDHNGALRGREALLPGQPVHRATNQINNKAARSVYQDGNPTDNIFDYGLSAYDMM